MFKPVFLSNQLKELKPANKVLLTLTVDFVMLHVMLVAAYMLRISAFEIPPENKLAVYLIAPMLSTLCAYLMGVYKAVARNYSSTVERQIVLSQVIAVLLWAFALFLVGTTGFARSVVLIYGLLAIFGMIVLRRLAASFFSMGNTVKSAKPRIPVIIYGAGAEGIVLAEQLRKQGGRQPLAFLDTDYTLVGRTVAGLRVYSSDKLQEVAERFMPQEVIVAKLGMSRAGRMALVDSLFALGLQPRIAPGISDIVDGNVRVGDVRPIRVEDLLGRDPVPPDRSLMEKAVAGQVVMVTGAGGSIGSELVRQCALYSPRRMLLVDHSEFALFEIHREMEAWSSHNGQALDLVPILADVQDKHRINTIMSEHRVDVVLHAAAYKHVRMVQENVLAGIRNNVIGTQVCAEAALENGVKRFILVSTDKAVRPTSVMGASKRLAEMIVQALSAQKGVTTIFSMVRFGNVLGSTGSVVPLFREQIAAGGPVTVTDPDVTRYFMLIPEAAQLVIQAGAMAEGGEVFVLDMGEPIRIVELARTMVELAGLRLKSPNEPDGDIEIVFTGLKQGEKLHEELEIGKSLAQTRNRYIMTAQEEFLPYRKLNGKLQKLMACFGDASEVSQAAARLINLAHWPDQPKSVEAD